MPDRAALLAAAQEKFPGLVEDIVVREDEDHVGDPSLFVEVTVPRGAKDRVAELLRLWDFVGNLAADGTRFPYVQFDSRQSK